MIVCSCNRISDADIELAILDLLSEPEAPLPTPGVVYRRLEKRMNCCGCAPLAVETIYKKVEILEKKGLISAYLSLSTREQLQRMSLFRKRHLGDAAEVTLSQSAAAHPFVEDEARAQETV